MRSFPWDSVVEAMGEDGYPIYDRSYDASDLREVHETFFSNGVFMNEEDAFTVTQGEGMNVIVSPGKCCIKGTIGYEKSTREIAIQSSSSQDRIDTVVLRWNANIETRSIDIYVKEGIASDIPVRPTLTRAGTIYELGIADIFIAKNTNSISAARITDTRLDSDRCGVVTALIDVDTTTLFNQIQAFIDEQSEYLEKESNRIIKELESSSASQMRELEAATDRAVELAQSLIDETFAGDVLKMLETIAKEHTLYTTIDDEAAYPLDDDDGNRLTGALVFATARKKEA